METGDNENEAHFFVARGQLSCQKGSVVGGCLASAHTTGNSLCLVKQISREKRVCLVIEHGHFR